MEYCASLNFKQWTIHNALQNNSLIQLPKYILFDCVAHGKWIMAAEKKPLQAWYDINIQQNCWTIANTWTKQNKNKVLPNL